MQIEDLVSVVLSLVVLLSAVRVALKRYVEHLSVDIELESLDVQEDVNHGFSKEEKGR